MKYLVIPINGKCDSKCIFCQFKRYKGDNKLKIEELNKYKEIYNTGDFESVLITDGEPLNHDNIYEIIKYILEFSNNLIIDTSGEKFSDNIFLENCNKLFNKKDIIINIPVYGSVSKIHNIITSGDFNKLIKGLINLKKLKNIRVRLHCLVLKQNYKDLKNIKKIAEQLGFDIKFIYTIPDGYIDLKKILVSFSQIYNYNDLEIENIPVCIKENSLNSFKYQISTTIIDGNIKKFKNDFASNRLEKTYIKKCFGCENKKNCSGIYKTYINLFGDIEFNKNETRNN